MHTILKTAGVFSVATLLACSAAYAAGDNGTGSAKGGMTASSGADNSGGSSNASTRTTGRDASGTSSQWDTENTYWRKNYSSRPYYNQSRDYSTMEPAYRYGVDLYNKNPGSNYDDLNASELESGWKQSHGDSGLSWNDAQKATRDAYNRLHENSKGASGSGR